LALNLKDRIKNKSDAGTANTEIPTGPRYIDPGPRPDEWKELRKWRKLVKKERKKLRGDLKLQGITSRREFEQIAWELGLILDKGKKAGALAWLYWAAGWFKTTAGLGTLLGSAAALLGGLFVLSAISDMAGAFTINLTTDMLGKGFILCEEPNFERPAGRLFSEKVKELNNITFEEIDTDVDLINGAHNGEQYVAYTFYIRNEGDTVASYQYNLTMDKSTLEVHDAVWLMLYEDGRQIVYAAPSANGDAEKLFGYFEPPFYDVAYDPDAQYYERDEEWGVQTTPFVDDKIVAQGVVMDTVPGETHKYTVVIWLEGNDPECVNDIFGGFAKYSMRFNMLEDDDMEGILSGIWRTEYDDYHEEVSADLNGTEAPEQTGPLPEADAPEHSMAE